MLKLYSLISGSSGNCTVVSDGKVHIMVDCGTSGKRASEALYNIGIDPSAISAILVTHEHSDHIKGVGILARRLGVPVYATRGTHAAMGIGSIKDEQIRFVSPDTPIDIAGIEATPFSIPHDAADPCCYSFSDGTDKVTIATDIGYMPDSLISRLIGSRSILLESNHDIDMLRFGPYPYPLQRRILGRHGHMSNILASETALELVKSGTEHIMLGHLSDKNNLPEIAMMETFNRLTDNGVNVGHDMTLQVAARYEITKMDG
ncbi:MAG: MBL fold metallo-hydrolase [Clostridia bacterium]|nr:MBL fold metallo-hydrolase [Clostridia bacterium]